MSVGQTQALNGSNSKGEVSGLLSSETQRPIFYVAPY